MRPATADGPYLYRLVFCEAGLNDRYQAMTTTATAKTSTHTAPRTQRVLARLRRKQLDLAIKGNVSDSARYAQRAWKVRLFGRKAA